MTNFAEFEPLRAGIAARMKQPNLDPEQIGNDYITTPEGAILGVRTPGAFVLCCALATPAHEVVDVAYCGPDITVTKLRAGHGMSPVGPYEGIGGQHGLPRWMDYLVSVDRTASYISMQSSTDQAAPMMFERNFTLRGDSLTTTNIAVNARKSTNHTSIGDHAYYAVPRTSLEGLLINGKSIDDALRWAGAGAAIARGNAKFWHGFDGQAEISFAVGNTRCRLEISAVAHNGRNEAPVDALLWAPPDETIDAFCFEPVVGYKVVFGNVSNNLQAVAARGALSLETTVQLLA
jgi:hypothetical protein